MRFGYKIEICPGDKRSEVVKQCDATDLDHAWDIARKDAWAIAVTARVMWVEDITETSPF